MAARLSEDSGTTVAVMEAGTFYQVTNPILSDTPAGDSFWCGSSPLDTNPLVDWNFVTWPQAGAAGRSIHYARGKQSYQQWADAVGDQSYTFDGLFPHFQKSVHFTPPASSRASNASAEYSASAFSSSGGPLEVSYANYAQPFSSYMDSAFGELGMHDAQDFNTGSLMGKQYYSSTIDPPIQKHESSQTAYYD